MQANKPPTCGYCAEKDHMERDCKKKRKHDCFNKKFENETMTGKKSTWKYFRN